ncbi:MAG: LAGLIDADG family homing endonuclease [bacterium]
MKPSNRIKTEWSSNLAYAVGLLTTDGCLYNDGRHIDFTSKDIQLIKTFKKRLGINNKIGYKTSGYSEKKYPHVQFGDVVFYRWLLSIGLMPRKSRTLGELKIPNEYFFDFLRGHYDGDGCSYSYWDKRWHSSFMFYTSFVSASKKHILWLDKKIKESSKINGNIRINKGQIYALKFAKEGSKAIFSKMYYREDLPCLSRKHRKVQKILKIEARENGRVL